MQAGAHHEAIEIGVRRPVPTPVAELGPGEVGYLIAGIKDVGEARSRRDRHHGDATAPPRPLPGLPRPQADGVLRPVPDRRRRLRGPPRLAREAQAQRRLDHLHAETSGALGFGFRCGFLGLLHMEIVKERLEREFDLALIATAPSVEYRVHRTDGDARRSSTTRPTCPSRSGSTSSRSRTSRSASSRRRTTRAR